MKNDTVIIGHSILAVERFRESTRHMAIYDVLDHRGAPFGEKGKRYRQFLPDKDYAALLEAQKRGYLRIKQHAAVVEGHILPDKKARHRKGKEGQN